MANGTESFSEKAIRHVKEGAFDCQTLRSGSRQFMLLAISHLRDLAGVSRLCTIENYQGIRDLSISEYRPMIVGKVRFPIRERIYDFPLGSQLDLRITENPSPSLYEDLLQETQVFGCIVGPTAERFQYSLNIANNGFYSSLNPEIFVPFPEEHMLAPGAKKGAFGQLEDGRLLLLDDTQVREVVSKGFEGFCYLAGTSFTLGVRDQELGNLDEGDLWCKSELSYLFQYLDTNDQLRSCYAITNIIASRIKVFEMISDYLKFRNGTFIRAVELEYTGADCHIKIKDGATDSFAKYRTALRLDHYLWKLPIIS